QHAMSFGPSHCRATLPGMDFELSADQQALRQRARDLADRAFAERAARWDASEEYPWDNVKDLAAAGFMGMTVPASYGGGGRPLLDVILVIEEIARACGITGRIVVEGNLGTVGALDAYGSEAQKRRWLPDPRSQVLDHRRRDLTPLPGLRALRRARGRGGHRRRLRRARHARLPHRTPRTHDGPARDPRGRAALRGLRGPARQSPRRSRRRLQEADGRLQRPAPRRGHRRAR